MTMFNYNENIPNGPNNPTNDQPKIQENTNSVNGLIEVDHVTFNENEGGYHKIIHEIPSSRARSGVGATFTNFPSGIPGINQIFTALYTPDTTVGGTPETQLFTTNGNGNASGVGVSQLTGSLITDPAQSDGYQWVGSILIQWGKVAPPVVPGPNPFPPGATGTVTFKDRKPGAIAFPNNCFSIQTTLLYRSTVPVISASVSIRTSGSSFSLSPTSFDWKSTAVTSEYRGFYWMAIGN